MSLFVPLLEFNLHLAGMTPALSELPGGWSQSAYWVLKDRGLASAAPPITALSCGEALKCDWRGPCRPQSARSVKAVAFLGSLFYIYKNHIYKKYCAILQANCCRLWRRSRPAPL
jgi:hypothetical protein